MTSTTIDAEEVAKFEAMAAAWWDPEGDFKPLHGMNPCRLDYISGQIAAEFGRSRKSRHPFQGLHLADIGCGGGLASEPMARLGCDVTGFDASPESLGIARAHAAQSGLEIDYRLETAEAAAARGAKFDVVLALEIVEHVADRDVFAAALAALLRPGGLLVMSTLNRTGASYAAAIIGAERILRWLPAGTHEWKKFPTPQELEESLTTAGLEVVDAQGMVLNPLQARWHLSPENLSINYLMTAVKPE